ncbi:MAG: hypothetical protein ISS34_03330 [Candidatus Omnitrophica bacterium]|nr:hypothetical protein [Candidatus Omnitrophota bacterium]
MAVTKTKTIESIEKRMDNIEPDTLRYRILQNARNFKTSWIDLGQALYSVWKDKLYKEWGYGKFEIYAAKEIGIRKATALKLIKSYYFLEREEPRYVDKEYTGESQPASVPTLESVDVLRLASRKKELDREDYSRIRKDVLELGKDARETKRDITTLIKQREELEPEEAWRKKRITVLKRFLSTLRSIKTELKTTKLLSAQITKDLESLISKVESEVT